MNPDRAVLDYVNRAINSGARAIRVPRSLLRNASKDALESVRQLCKLGGVTLSVAGDE